MLVFQFYKHEKSRSTDRHFKGNILQIIDKEQEADFFFMYKLEPKASVCISDKNQMRMFYLSYPKFTCVNVQFYQHIKDVINLF